MKIVFAAVALLLCPVARGRTITDIDLDDDKQYPVTKVVTLLKDMQQQLEKEAEEDEEVYDKMACWCKTNDREKTQAIKTANARIGDLTATIESSTASSARLKAEITNHQSDHAKASKSLDVLTGLRQKQAKEFNSEEKDMLQSVSSLGAAIVVVSKHHKTSLISDSSLNSIAEVVRSQISKHKMMLLGVITPHQKKLLNLNLIQDGASPKFRSAQPQSGEIHGILRQMKETFEGNLADAQKQEISDSKAFEEQKQAKQEEIKAIQHSLDVKKTHLAKSDETNAQAKEDLEDTQNSLTIDEQFLVDLKERCKMTDQEWETRQKARQQEITAIVNAIAILSDDAARDNFSKTFNKAAAASFVQTNVIHGARGQVVQLLRAVAEKYGNPALSGLAMVAQLDAFTKVKKSIYNLVVELAEESKTEIVKKDFCIDEMHVNANFIQEETGAKQDTEMYMATVETNIKELKTSLKALKTEVSEMNLQIKRAGEDRELASKDFQETVQDQRTTQRLLNKAVAVLKAVYSGQVSLATQKSVVKRPPSGFKDYSQNGGGGGAVALLTQIIGDAKVMEAEAVKDEQVNQSNYEKYVRDTNDAIKAKENAIVNKSEDKAVAVQDLAASKDDLEGDIAEIASLNNEKADLELQCNYLLKNFEVRQQARGEEIEALKQAKAILSGMQVD